MRLFFIFNFWFLIQVVFSPRFILLGAQIWWSIPIIPEFRTFSIENLTIIRLFTPGRLWRTSIFRNFLLRIIPLSNEISNWIIIVIRSHVQRVNLCLRIIQFLTYLSYLSGLHSLKVVKTTLPNVLLWYDLSVLLLIQISVTDLAEIEIVSMFLGTQACHLFDVDVSFALVIISLCNLFINFSDGRISIVLLILLYGLLPLLLWFQWDLL